MTPFAARVEAFTDLVYDWIRNHTSLDEMAATELAESLADELRETVLTNDAPGEPT